MDVSVIIVNYNTCELTLQCLSSVYKQTSGVDFEVIVIDNASKDNSVEKIRENFPEVLVVINDENKGFGQANNLAVKYSKGTFLFFLNSDTMLLNNAILLFWEYWYKQCNLGCLGSFLLDANLNYTHSFGCFPTFSSIIARILKYTKKSERKKNIRSDTFLDVDYITGADLFISKELFISLGGFHKRFFMYYEETYLQFLVNARGLRRLLIDGPQIVHLEGASYQKQYSNKKRIQMDKSLFTFLELSYGYYKSTLFKVCYVLLRLPVFFNRHFTFKDNLYYIKSLLI